MINQKTLELTPNQALAIWGLTFYFWSERGFSYPEIAEDIGFEWEDYQYFHENVRINSSEEQKEQFMNYVQSMMETGISKEEFMELIFNNPDITPQN